MICHEFSIVKSYSEVGILLLVGYYENKKTKKIKLLNDRIYT